MDIFNIPVVLGTARQGRFSEYVARFVHQKFTEHDGIDSKLIDIRDHTYTITTPPWGVGGANEKKTQWKEIIENADALVIVTPEYNHGYPGELKLLLDSLYDEYEKKPVALCGVSAGGLGGAHVVEHLKQVLIEFKMVPIRNAVYFSNVKDLFTENGTIKDASYGERIDEMLKELLWYAQALKDGRKNK
ncbi:NAD(P)H-dependent oxidoreductase [Patescibacteria group bacterium]|nr:NAD(P)H-dependent oxidoreductase [Patescibacteria group bacterium]